MSNRELAAKIIHHMTGDLQRAHYVAEELADAGLLAPGVPEPQRIGQELVWHLQHHEWEVIATDGYIRLSDERGAFLALDRKTARELGHALLAAANYSQEGNRE